MATRVSVRRGETEMRPGAAYQSTARSIRHFYASVLIDAGESVRAVADYLGQSDPGFTLRVYAHLFPSSDDRARKPVDRLLSATDPHAISDRPPAVF